MHKIIQIAFILIFGASVAYSQDVLLKGVDIVFTNPVVSPSGEYMAVTSKGYNGLWIANRDGSNLTKISNEIGAGFMKTWSSDSKSLVFRETVYSGRKRDQMFKSVTIASLEQETLIATSGRSDGFNLIGKGNVYINSKSGVRAEYNPLATDATRYDPSVFLDDFRIYLGYPTGANPVLIDPVPGERYLNPVLSPNKELIAFEVVGGNLFAYNIADGRLYDLGKGERPAWSPDSKNIAYHIAKDDGHKITSSDIFMSAYDGSTKKMLTQTPEVFEMRPAFFPDGNRIVYDTYMLGEIRALDISE